MNMGLRRQCERNSPWQQGTCVVQILDWPGQGQEALQRIGSLKDVPSTLYGSGHSRAPS